MRAKKLWASAGLVLLIVLGGTVPAFSQTDWVAFDRSASPVKPRAVVQQSTSSACVINFRLDGLFVNEITE
ncbi:MAG: hypothetical protein P8181_07335 [bacterium]